MNLTYANLSDRRLEQLAHDMRWSLDTTLGTMCAFWLRSQEAMLLVGNALEVTSHMRTLGDQEDAKIGLLHALLRCGFVEDLGEGEYRIVDNAQALKTRQARRDASILGLEAQAKRRKRKARAKPILKPEPVPEDLAEPSASEEDMFGDALLGWGQG